MPVSTHKPRLALLGAGPRELETLAELQATGRVDFVGVYDSDPRAVGLGIAELLGLPSGHDPQTRARLADADFVILPQDRQARRETVEWASGLHADLLSLDEARRRWGGAGSARGRTARSAGLDAAEELDELVLASTRMREKSELADWLLGIAMRAVGATGGSLQLLAPDTSELYLVAARGLSQRLLRLGRHRVGEGVAGTVAATREPQVLHGPKPGRIQRERGEISTSISLPLEDRTTLIGVLNVSSAAKGKRFDHEHVGILQKLAPRLAALLHDAQRVEVGADLSWVELPSLLRRLDEQALDVTGRFSAVCEHLAAAFSSDHVAIYIATEAGDWLALGAARRSAPHGPAPSRKALTDAYLEQSWHHVSERVAAEESMPPAQPTVDAPDVISRAVDHALQPGEEGAFSRLYAPLSGARRVGVVLLEFATLDTAERCLHLGRPLIQQIGLYVEAQVRESRQARRLTRLGQLARLVSKLLELRGQTAFLNEIVTSATQLVGGRSAVLRLVDETRSVYSQPITHGFSATELEAWRPFDDKVVERTIQFRRSRLTTTAQAEADGLGEETDVRSLVSVPILHQDRLVAVLNVYEKIPDDVLETRAFTDSDRDLLESLAVALAPLVGETVRDSTTRGESESEHERETRPPDRPEAVPETEPEPAPETEPEPETKAEPEPEIQPELQTTPPVEPRRRPTASDPHEGFQSDSLEAFQREIERAARYHRGLGVSVLHFEGLADVRPSERYARQEKITLAVRSCVRSSDVFGWRNPDELVVASPEALDQPRVVEERLRRVLEPHVSVQGPGTGSGLQVRIGSSSYPGDGGDLEALLNAALERAR